MAKLTLKQERFCREYVRLAGNGTQAAIAAGYAPKNARITASQNLTKPSIRARIEQLQAKMKSESIADAQEVMQLLTEIARGKMTEEVVVINGAGDVHRTRKTPSVKDRNKAVETLARVLGMTLSDAQVTVAPVIIAGEDKLHD